MVTPVVIMALLWVLATNGNEVIQAACMGCLSRKNKGINEMNIQIKKKWVVLGLTAWVLAGCATGTKINDDGSTDEAKWKQWDQVTLNKTRGTFPDLQSLSQVRSGMTKDQLYYLIGRPHYNDGWRPREWNYLFHFHTPGQGTDDVTTCQYKVVFDKNMFARSFYWHAVDPENGVCPPDAKASATALQRYTLSADALFAFDKSNPHDLNAQGKTDLDNLVRKLKSFDRLNAVNVMGHTDYLGSDEYNQGLSQRRAETVRQYLISQGLPAGKIRAVGLGERQPVKQCAATANRAELIACLQPNRRVEIEVDGSGTLK